MTQEIARAFGGRRVENLFWGPLLNNATCVAYRDPVADATRE
jgi:hypothetical protein